MYFASATMPSIARGGSGTKTNQNVELTLDSIFPVVNDALATKPSLQGSCRDACKLTTFL